MMEEPIRVTTVRLPLPLIRTMDATIVYPDTRSNFIRVAILELIAKKQKEREQTNETTSNLDQTVKAA